MREIFWQEKYEIDAPLTDYWIARLVFFLAVFVLLVLFIISIGAYWRFLR